MLLLASQSPRRSQLLAQLGVEFSVIDVDVPEQREVGEAALDYVRRVARDKAMAGLAAANAGSVVLAADTEVVLDDIVFGKPADADDAAAMLRRLSGREHDVISVVWVVDADAQRSAVCQTRVRVAQLGDDDIAAYIASGECFGKAGAYAIQGRFAAYVEGLQGSHSSVMGLPLHETARLLRQAGLF